MQPKRVCIRLPNGRLLAATAAQSPGILGLDRGALWVPVPDTVDGRVLGSWDDGRPLGVPPAVWYGWPKGQTEMRDVWLVSDGNNTREVLAYDAEHAIKVCGFERAVIQSVQMKERWY